MHLPIQSQTQSYSLTKPSTTLPSNLNLTPNSNPNSNSPPTNMPYTVILLLTRKPHLTPTQFRHHFETTHLPLVKRLFGPLCPVPKRRIYFAQSQSKSDTNHPNNNNSNNNHTSNNHNPVQTHYLPWLLKGDPETVDFDCITELEWPDEETFRKFQAELRTPEKRECVERDQEVFMGVERIVVVGEVVVEMPGGWEGEGEG